MSKAIRFDHAARAEVLEASRWYERQRHGLRAEFLAALDDAVARVGRIGHTLAVVKISPALAVRRLHLARFPYSLVFIELPTRIRVLAVAHDRQRPRYWHTRVTPDE